MNLLELSAWMGCLIAAMAVVSSANRLRNAIQIRNMRMLGEIKAPNTVLLLEPNKPLRFLISTMLGSTLNVLSVATPEKLQKVIKEGITPGAIIADISDEKSNPMVQQLRSKRWLGQIPLFVLSNQTHRDNELIGPFLEQITHYYSKPFNPIDLYNDVINALPSVERSVKEKHRLSSLFDEMGTTAPFAKLSIGKRIFDILASIFLLIVSSPLFIIIPMMIALSSKGPIFYRAKRAGRGYKIFDFYKFRTMEAYADKKIDQLKHLNQYNSDPAGPVFFKISNDPRITKVGRFLRNTSLDELPQLWNVLKGDMSFVGNRPLPLYEAQNLTTDEYSARFMAPAGITGLWQIKKRGKKDMSVEERMNLDITYAQKSESVSKLFDDLVMLLHPLEGGTSETV